MEIKMYTLVNSQQSLEEICQAKGLNALTAYKLARNKQKITDELKAYNEAVMNIVNKYGLKDDNGNPKTNDKGAPLFPRENIDNANAELRKVDDITVDIDIKKINLDDLASVDLSANDILSLEFMLNIDEDD